MSGQTIHFRAWEHRKAFAFCRAQGIGATSPNPAKVTCRLCRAKLDAEQRDTLAGAIAKGVG